MTAIQTRRAPAPHPVPRGVAGLSSARAVIVFPSPPGTTSGPPVGGDRAAAPSQASSAGEGGLSRGALDPPRSNVGPAPVQILACRSDTDDSAERCRRKPDPLIEALRVRLGDHCVKKVARDLGAPHGTVKKWFLGQTAPSGRRVGDIFRVYGDLLAGALEEPA